MNNILCLGDFSSGKSAFLNMLLGVSILPAKLESTNIPVIKIHCGDAAGLYLREPGEKNPKHIACWSQIPEDWSSFEYVELTVPNHPLLDKGLVFWDSPGINSTNDHHTKHVEAFLTKYQDQFHSILFFISEQILDTHIQYIQQWKMLQPRIRILINVNKKMDERDCRRIETHVKREVGIRLGAIPVELLYLWEVYAEFDDLSFAKHGDLNDQARLALWEKLAVDFSGLKEKHQSNIIGEVIFDILQEPPQYAHVLYEEKKINIITEGAGKTKDAFGTTWILVEGLEKPFYIASTPVTFEQFDKFCEATGAEKPSDEGWGRGNLPAVNIRWHDAVAYCEWASRETGATIRLPNEKEWLYAARGGPKTKKFRYSGSSKFEKVGWSQKNSGGKTHDVGTKKANELGIYDMSGNVWEWCLDAYRGGNYRILRGGSWDNRIGDCAIDHRAYANSDKIRNRNGFRLMKSLI